MKSRYLVAFGAMLATTTATIVPVAPAHAQMAVVDVKGIAQMVKQVKLATDQLNSLKSQLNLQQQMLNRIGVDISPELTSIMRDANSIMNSASGIGYNAKNLSSQIDQLYPRDMLGQAWDQIASQQRGWEQLTRDARREAMEAQSTIMQNQSRTQSAVERAVQASQGADGQTAAVQATNQLLAAVSAQLSGLQTLLVTQMRAAESANAQIEAQKAAGTARHRKNFGNPNELPKFGNGY